MGEGICQWMQRVVVNVSLFSPKLTMTRWVFIILSQVSQQEASLFSLMEAVIYVDPCQINVSHHHHHYNLSDSVMSKTNTRGL